MNSGAIEVDPMPPRSAIQPCSIDLQLGEWIYVFRRMPDDWMVVDPFDALTYSGIGEFVHMTISGGHVIQPGEFILGVIAERVRMDNLHSGQLEGKSSIGRLGIEVHCTAGLIDPGFNGHPTLEISNKLPRPVRLIPRMYISQMIVMKLDTISNGYEGKYQEPDEVRPVLSRYHMNPCPNERKES